MHPANNGGSPRILIADDHALFRSGLRGILAACPRRPRIDEAATGVEVLKLVAEASYDCILLDILLPDMNGFEIIKRLKVLRPGVRVLVLSMYPEDQFGVRALKAGAAGYLTKNSAPELLLEAVRRVCASLKYISPALVEMLSDDLSDGKPASAAPHERLTDRELQVLTLIASGKTVSDIGRELHLSVKTVSVHRGHILGKMGLKNNAELIKYAVNNGLVF